MFSVEKNVPVVEAKRGRVAVRPSRYPVAQMLPGDSFFVNSKEDRFAALRTAKMLFSNHAEKPVFISRAVEGGFRIWRLS